MRVCNMYAVFSISSWTVMKGSRIPHFKRIASVYTCHQYQDSEITEIFIWMCHPSHWAQQLLYPITPTLIWRDEICNFALWSDDLFAPELHHPGVNSITAGVPTVQGVLRNSCTWQNCSSKSTAWCTLSFVRLQKRAYWSFQQNKVRQYEVNKILWFIQQTIFNCCEKVKIIADKSPFTGTVKVQIRVQNILNIFSFICIELKTVSVKFEYNCDVNW